MGWNKYNARRTLCNKNHPHPSALEAAVCGVLTLRALAGEIHSIKWIASVYLGLGIRWKIDFGFIDSKTKEPVLAEAKGTWTKDSKMKLKMYENGGGKYPLEIWRGSYKRPILEKIIQPKLTIIS